MEFRILGSLEAESSGTHVPLGGRREQCVLAALLLDAGRVVPMPRLVDAAWDNPPATASKQAMNAVSRLRRVLGGAGGGDLIVTVAGGYRLAADGCTVDARVFEARVAAAGQAASEGKIAEAAGSLRSALALWRGPALAGLAGREIEAAAAGWDERRVAAQETYFGLELALGRHREVLGALAGLVAGHPLREKLAALYMLALYRCSRQADALAVYGATRELLAGQLGLDPGPELRGLHQQILTADPALAPLCVAPMPTADPPAQGSHAGRAGTPQESAAPVAPQVRYALPADTAAFTGRSGELAQIEATIQGAAGGGGVVAVGAIDGMPGVGKTTLAVHVAHSLTAQFPDRQLFIDLHGHTPGHEPVKAVDALAGLLAAAGVDARNLPGDLPGRAGLWRDRMAGQRALLVLDNAAGSSQVAPLLPGGGGCLVLVTSRRHLGDLPGAVSPVLVGVLPPQEAAQMFTRLAPRAAGDGAGVAEVVALAGFLPLAISLLARVFARHPSWTLADLAAETRGGVLTLAAESDSVAAAFDVSYRHLDRARQRFFRHLGVHPGTSIDAYAASALADVPLADAVGLLDGLHGEGLLTETGYRRYGLHDLIRRYSQDLAAADPAVGRNRALDRLLDYYQHTAAMAQALLTRQPRPGPAAPTALPTALPRLQDRKRALAWARAERGNLLACLDHATRTGQGVRVIALTAAMAALLRQDGPWADAITRHDTAVHAARRLGDQQGEADTLIDLGVAQRLTGDYPGAAKAFGAALGIYRDLGNRLGQGNALTQLGGVQQLTGDYPDAIEGLQEALGIYRDLGNRLGQAGTLGELGGVRRLTGDYPGATEALEEALRFYRDLGDRQGQAAALGELGGVRRLTGDYPGATEALEEALGIFGDLVHRQGQAAALAELGRVRRLTGDYPGATEALEEALGISRDLGNRLVQGSALKDLGALRSMARDYSGAARALEEALGIFRDLGDRGNEAKVLNEAGTLHRLRGDLDQARACHRRALHLARQIGSSQDEACALADLGRCDLSAGHTASGQASLRQAQEIFRSIGAADASAIAAELSA